MIHRILLAALFLSTLAAPAMASPSLPADFHVDADAAPGGDGVTWATAFDTLQAALAVATSGHRIWVADGRYDGGFDVPDGVVLLGGFEPGHFRETQRRPFKNFTVLDGGDQERVLELGDGSVLDGFIVQNGSAGGLGGGGALVDGTDPTIRNSVFRANRNVGGRGSALLVRSGGNPTVESTIFYDNRGSGHAVDVDAAGGTYDHIVVHENISNGFHIQRGSDPEIRNSVFSGNEGRGVCHINASDRPLLENCVFFDNRVSLMHYRGIELRTIEEVNDLSYASLNLDSDPRFRGAAVGDFRLAFDSPCIDQGIPVPGSQLHDPYLTPRTIDGDGDRTATPDIGALEYSSILIDIEGDVAPGQDVRLTALGTDGLKIVFTAGEPGCGETIDPVGTWFVDSTLPVRMINLGRIPFDEVVRIPPRIPSGTGMMLQAVAFGQGQANFSNFIDLLIR